MSVLPLLLTLQLLGTNILTSTSATMALDCEFQPRAEYSLAGCYRPDTDVIILNADFANQWNEIIAHEYAHRVSIKNNLLNGVNDIFGDEETFAWQFSSYWQDPKQYRSLHPDQADWFQKVTPLYHHSN